MRVFVKELKEDTDFKGRMAVGWGLRMLVLTCLFYNSFIEYLGWCT